MALAVAFTTAFVAGCGPPGRGPEVVVPPRPAPQAGYDGRRDSLDTVDPRVLRGRRIVLDPGHGGYFPGTVGVGGLTEKEVNLAVALELRALLAAAGAQVLMTRETDRDFLVVVPALTVSELSVAFEIGFLIFLPFLVVDLVISNILMAMGMQMLSPTTVSMPFKLLLFVLIDGWVKLTHGLILTYV